MNLLASSKSKPSLDDHEGYRLASDRVGRKRAELAAVEAEIVSTRDRVLRRATADDSDEALALLYDRQGEQPRTPDQERLRELYLTAELLRKAIAIGEGESTAELTAARRAVRESVLNEHKRLVAGVLKSMRSLGAALSAERAFVDRLEAEGVGFGDPLLSVHNPLLAAFYYDNGSVYDESVANGLMQQMANYV